MRGSLAHSIALGVLLVSVTAGQGAAADDDDHADHERAKRLQRSGEILSLEVIVERAHRLNPTGKVLEIEFTDKHERWIYEIEILNKSGVVNELTFDARTGKLLEAKEKE